MTEPQFEVGTAVSFTSSHVMPGAEGPEGILHDHHYRVEVVVSRSQLDDQGTVCDLLVLEAALDRLREKVEGQDLEVIKPSGAAAVTVEVFAEWAHGFLARSLAGTGAEVMAVRVWESEVAFGGFRDRLF